MDILEKGSNYSIPNSKFYIVYNPDLEDEEMMFSVYHQRQKNSCVEGESFLDTNDLEEALNFKI